MPPTHPIVGPAKARAPTPNWPLPSIGAAPSARSETKRDAPASILIHAPRELRLTSDLSPPWDAAPEAHAAASRGDSRAIGALFPIRIPRSFAPQLRRTRAAPSCLYRTTICTTPASAAAMSTRGTAFSFATAIAILAAAAPACIDRALPGGTLQGLTAGDKAWLRAERAAAVVPPDTFRVPTTDWRWCRHDRNRNGRRRRGAPSVVPTSIAPRFFCPRSRALDGRGCETCGCAPGPGPGDCEDFICGPRPPPPANCLEPEMTCAPHGDQCVWMTKCKPPLPCAAAECSRISTTFRPRRVTTARCSRPQGTRDVDTTCRWHYYGLSAVVRRAGNPGDVRQGGRLPVADTRLRGAHDPGHGVRRQGRHPRLQQRVHRAAQMRAGHGGFLHAAETPAGATCDDAVCRDVGIAVCAWW